MNPNSMTNERLCTLAQKGDEAARELLVEKNMGFIVQTADIVYRSSSLEGSDLNIDMDDLVQEGSIGLLRAVDGFDPARKLKFLTYAALPSRTPCSTSYIQRRCPSSIAWQL